MRLPWFSVITLAFLRETFMCRARKATKFQLRQLLSNSLLNDFRRCDLDTISPHTTTHTPPHHTHTGTLLRADELALASV